MKTDRSNMKTLEGLSSFVLSVSLGATWRDKMTILTFVILPKIVLFPFYFLNINLWFFLMKFLYKLTPQINLDTDFGKFECRKNSLDFSHLNLFYEKSLTPFFNITDGVFIDIGSHVGRYAVMVGRNIKKGKVVAVEPEPSNFKALERNIQLNKLGKKVIPLNVAVSDKNGRLKLYLEDLYGGGGHSTIKGWEKSENCVDVESMTLDNIVKLCRLKTSDIKLLKIDVEGAEFNVLKGASEVLKQHPKIVFESADKRSLAKCMKMLYSFGYKINQIDEVNFFAHR